LANPISQRIINPKPTINLPQTYPAADLAENNKLDLICLSLSRFDGSISSAALSLAKEFAKNNRVFFIDHPYSWKDYFNSALKEQIRWRKPALLFGKTPYSNPASFPANLTIVTARLTLPINSLPKGFLYNISSKINDGIVKKTIQNIIRDYHVKDYVFMNFYDPFFLNRVSKEITPVRSIYYCMDKIGEVPYFQKHGAQQEETCMRNYDLTFCTSSELTRFASEFSPKVHFLPNGADTVLFNKAVVEKLPRPPEIQSIHTPIIGFTGNIDFRIDFELLRKIALDNPDKTMVFVGPFQTDGHIKVGLDKMKNVLFVGPRQITDIPNYHQCFDCAIVPFVKTKLTQSVYPLKINEYLAAGLPVIATNFSNDIKSFSHVAYIVDTHEGFLQAIRSAIRENTPERVKERMNVAAQNSWSARVKKFWDILSTEMRPKQAVD
jgi:teichuronic acid biosynthesis glycosyltransferase TuaH